MKKGHWFCDHCDDIVFMSYERITSKNVPCPVCGHCACNFIPHKISRAVLAAHWFEAMREAVDAATTPEIFDQRPRHEIWIENQK